MSGTVRIMKKNNKPFIRNFLLAKPKICNALKNIIESTEYIMKLLNIK